jgi:site-specific DNA-methyltransferase (adenine-specific)
MTPYFDDGTVTIYHGDCREILPMLAYDCVVTDPPYGIGIAAQPTRGQRRAGQQAESWDDVRADDVVERLARGARPAVIWGGNYYALAPARGWLFWIKPDAPPSMGGAEMAWTNIDQNTRYISCSISSTNPERVGHKTQKPLRVMTWSLGFVAGAIVDPFMGSGTTLRAAKDLGRRAIGIEINERYCEIAARRMSQQTLFAAGMIAGPEPPS